jgi:hypothetical protein
MRRLVWTCGSCRLPLLPWTHSLTKCNLSVCPTTSCAMTNTTTQQQQRRTEHRLCEMILTGVASLVRFTAILFACPSHSSPSKHDVDCNSSQQFSQHSSKMERTRYKKYHANPTVPVSRNTTWRINKVLICIRRLIRLSLFPLYT